MADDRFRIFYNPQPFPVRGEYLLSAVDTFDEAVRVALNDAKIWGPTWIKKGRKIIFRSDSY